MAVNGHNVTISTTVLFVNSTELKQLSLGASTHVNATFPFDVYYATHLSIRYLSFWAMLFFFSLIGILGNLTTLYVLVRQWGCRSTFTLFTAMLAATQTLKCTVMVPLFLYAMLSQVSQNTITSTVCKFHRTATTFFMLSTCLLLLLGALARHIMAASPWKITNFNVAKLKAASGLSISVFISLPAMVIYGTVEDETHSPSKIGFLERCIILPEYRDSLSSKAFIGLVDSFFTLFTVILLLTYTCLCRRFEGRIESRLGSRNISTGELFPSRSWSDYSFLMDRDTGTPDRLGGLFVTSPDGEGEVMGREIINSMIDFESMFNKHHVANTKSAVGDDADKATGQPLQNPGSIFRDPAMPGDKADDVVSKDAVMKHAPSTSKSKEIQLERTGSSSVDNIPAYIVAAMEANDMRDVFSDPSDSNAIYIGPKNRTQLAPDENAIIPFDSDSELFQDSVEHPRSLLKRMFGKRVKCSTKRDERSARDKYLRRYSGSPRPNSSQNANDEKNSDTKDGKGSAGVKTTTKPSNHALTTPVIAHTSSTLSLGNSASKSSIGSHDDMERSSILNFVAPNLLAPSQTSLDKGGHNDHQTETIGEAVKKMSRVKVSVTMFGAERNPSDENHMTMLRKKSVISRMMESESSVYCAEEAHVKRSELRSNDAILPNSQSSAVSAEPRDVNHTQPRGMKLPSMSCSSKSLPTHPPKSETNTVVSCTHSAPSPRGKSSQVDANVCNGCDVVKKGHRVLNPRVSHLFPIEPPKFARFVSAATGSAQGGSGSVQSPKAQPQAQQNRGGKGKTRMHKLMSKPLTLKNLLKRRSRDLKKRMSRRFSWGDYHQETRGIMSFSRTFVVSCLLFLSFLSSYIPIVVLQSLEVFLPEYYKRMTGELYPLKHVFYLLFFISDFVHPIIWGFVNNSFRQEVRQLFSDCGWKRHLILESQSDLQSCTGHPPTPRPSIL